MDHQRFANWLKNIYETQENEISCSECFDLVSRFVEIEIAGDDATGRYAHLTRRPRAERTERAGKLLVESWRLSTTFLTSAAWSPES